MQEMQEYSPECLHGYTLVKTLGRGEFGVAYLTDAGIVLKVILINKKSTQANFDREYQIGHLLGNMGIAPQIYDAWMCEGRGFYTMQTLTGVWKDVYGYTLPRTDIGQIHQERLIGKLNTMVHSGYLHQDCHVGNIGFIGEDVMLFDFGFTIPTGQVITPSALNAMFISQLYIVIEQYSYADKYDVNNLMNSKINEYWSTFPENFLMREPLNYQNISVGEQNAVMESFVTWVAHHTIGENDTVQKNIVLCFLYRYIDFVAHNYVEKTRGEFSTDDYDENHPQFPRKVYDLIYNIRKNQFANLREIGLGLPTLKPFVKKPTFEWSQIAFGGKRNKRTRKRRKPIRTKRRNPRS